MKAQVNPKSTSNQSSKPCTVLQYPSKKQYFGYSDNDPLRCRLPSPPQQRSMCLCHEPHHAHIQDTKTSREGIAKIFCTDFFFLAASCPRAIPSTRTCAGLLLRVRWCLWVPVPWLIHMCDMTLSHVWHAAFACVSIFEYLCRRLASPPK